MPEQNKVVEAIKSYLKTVTEFEKATSAFNAACTKIRNDCQPGVYLVRIDGVCYSLLMDKDLSFEVKQVEETGCPSVLQQLEGNEREPDCSMESDFAKDLQRLINSHSIENESDTPDFVLATFMSRCLAAFAEGVRGRDEYYGIKTRGYFAEIQHK